MHYVNVNKNDGVTETFVARSYNEQRADTRIRAFQNVQISWRVFKVKRSNADIRKWPIFGGSMHRLSAV